MIENKLTDPFTGSIPGESLASSKLGSLPLDLPAKISDPEEALDFISGSILSIPCCCHCVKMCY